MADKKDKEAGCDDFLAKPVEPKKMDELSVSVSMCPYDRRLSDFFKAPGKLCWVVDYRFVPVVPKKQLYGMVVPDLSKALKDAVKAEKGTASEISVEYDYEKL